jgi:hypothetical protein
MDRFNHRTKDIIIVLLPLVIRGMLFYQALYASTAEALSRAEYFVFTRMTVARPGEQGAMRYFFVTNRKKTDDNEIPEDRFSAEHEMALKFGLFDTVVERWTG